MSPQEMQSLLRIILKSGKFGQLTDKQQAVVLMIADPEFRQAVKLEGRSDNSDGAVELRCDRVAEHSGATC